MKRVVFKKVVFLLLPILLIALSPVHVMVCQGAMKDCSPCCPKMMKAGERFHPQVASEGPSCCTVYQWEAAPFTNPALLKADVPFNGKFVALVPSVQGLMKHRGTVENSKKPLAALHPIPSSLFILKQSFLI